jgi:glycosyltransferase involved in cell wall biosynthesis
MFPARILGDKGVHEFIHAARALKADGAQARFILVGRRDPANPTDVAETAIRGWEAEGVVEWWGFRTDMPQVLPQAHIVCMPSYREGLPRGLIEAAACGLPIVTADVPGCREVVRHGESGFLVPARDGPATAAAIEKLLNDAGLRRSMGRAARQLALDEFTVEAFVADTLATYDAVRARK